MRAPHFQEIQQKLFLSYVHRLSLSSLVRPGLALVIVCGLVAGCSTGNQGTVSTVSGVTMQGRVRGGQQPVTGAQVYLFAAGATGYGSAPTSLLTGSGVTTDGNGNGYVTSDSSGNFSVTGDYTCPSASSEIYVMARGGNPGLPGNVNNSSLALMAAAGTCGSLTSSTFLQVDEQTTTAAAFMLAPFATVATGATGSARESFATSSTNAAGLANGAQTIQYVLGQGAGAGFNTVADILSVCVNSSGSTGECSGLFALATPAGGTAPQDTLEVALTLARNPGLNTESLFALIPAQAPFQPTYTIAPNSWLQSGGGNVDLGNMCPGGTTAQIGGSTYLENYALDSTGRIWTGLKCSGTGFLDTGLIYGKTAPTTADQNTDYGMSGFLNKFADAFAVDQSDVVWYLDTTSVNTPIVVKLAPGLPSAGVYSRVMSPSTAPSLLAFDASGNVWLGEGSSFETGIPASYTSPPATKLTGNGTAVAMAFDGSGNLWTANQGNTVSKYTIFFSSFSSSALFSGGGLNGPGGIAIDHAGNVWVTNTTGNSLSKFDNNGNALSPSGGFTGGGMNGPVGVAVDGDGNVWVSSPGAGVLSKFDSNGNVLSPGGGFTFSATTDKALQIDNVGNVWVGGSVFYGAAAPVTIPLSAAVAGNSLGARP